MNVKKIIFAALISSIKKCTAFVDRVYAISTYMVNRIDSTLD